MTSDDNIIERAARQGFHLHKHFDLRVTLHSGKVVEGGFYEPRDGIVRMDVRNEPVWVMLSAIAMVELVPT